MPVWHAAGTVSGFSPALRLVRPIHKIRGFYYSSPMAILGLPLPLKGRCMALYKRALYRRACTRSSASAHITLTCNDATLTFQPATLHHSHQIDEESESTALSYFA